MERVVWMYGGWVKCWQQLGLFRGHQGVSVTNISSHMGYHNPANRSGQ
jgi:hypothetical protein